MAFLASLGSTILVLLLGSIALVLDLLVFALEAILSGIDLTKYVCKEIATALRECWT